MDLLHVSVYIIHNCQISGVSKCGSSMPGGSTRLLLPWRVPPDTLRINGLYDLDALTKDLTSNFRDNYPPNRETDYLSSRYTPVFEAMD